MSGLDKANVGSMKTSQGVLPDPVAVALSTIIRRHDVKAEKAEVIPVADCGDHGRQVIADEAAQKPSGSLCQNGSASSRRDSSLYGLPSPMGSTFRRRLEGGS